MGSWRARTASGAIDAARWDAGASESAATSYAAFAAAGVVAVTAATASTAVPSVAAVAAVGCPTGTSGPALATLPAVFAGIDTINEVHRNPQLPVTLAAVMDADDMWMPKL